MKRWVAVGAGLVLIAACGGGSGATPSSSVSSSTTPSPTGLIAPTTSPSPSPGGDIAYVGSDGGVWLMNADGSGAHEIDDSSRGYAFMPEWSQDGTKIAFTRIGYVSGTPSPDLTYADLVSAVFVDESGRELTSVPSGFLPHWSPDSTRISFLANFAAHDYGNFWLADPSILTLASGAITTVTTQIRALDSPRWSPDGSMLAYFGQTEGVYVAAGDGGAPSRIFGGQSNTGYAALSWIDDGALVMSEISDVEGTPKYVVIDVAGGATTELSADGVFGCIGRDIAPGDGQEFSVANGQEFVWSLPCAKPPGISEG